MSNPFKDLDKRAPRARSDTLGARRIDLANAGVFHRTPGHAILTFSGQVADGETVTYTTGDGEAFVFEFDDDGSVASGNIAVDITGNGSAADDITDLTNVMFATLNIAELIAFPNNQGAQTTPQLVLIGVGPRSVGAVLASDASNITVRQQAGDVPHDSPNILVTQRTPLASEVTDGFMNFPSGPGMPIHGYIVQVQDAIGQPVAWDGNVVNWGLNVVIDNAGSTDWTTSHTVTVVMFGANVDWTQRQVLD